MSITRSVKPSGLAICCAALLIIAGSRSILAQSPPVDLTQLSLEQLLEIQLIGYVSEEDPELLKVTEFSTQLAYQYVHNHFEDYLDGSDRLSAEEVLAEFPVVPNRIVQQAHILSLSHQTSSNLTFLIEGSYIHQTTDHIRRKGDPFTITTEGFGDLLTAGIYRFLNQPSYQLYALGAVSLPTGSIDEKGDTPRGKNTQVPYTMQIGSGTFDLQPGLLYLAQSDRIRWGAELNTKIRLGRNDRDYSLGDRYTLSTWIKAPLTRRVEPILKLSLTEWEKIDGQDDELNPEVAPVADPNLFGGTRVNLSGGLKIAPRGQSSKWILSLEGGIPVYQSLNGPQPRQEWHASAALFFGL